MSWRRLLPLAELTPGATRSLEVDDEGLLLWRGDSDTLVAFADACSHDGAPLGELACDGDVIECPRHGARFDARSGAATRLPATAPLLRYPVRVDPDGVIAVDLEGEA